MNFWPPKPGLTLMISTRSTSSITCRIAATGVATHALVGWPADPATAKILWGAIGSAIAGAVVFKGGFALFERLMAISIGVMFIAVCATAIRLLPEWSTLAAGFVPSDPGEGEPRDWTIRIGWLPR